MEEMEADYMTSHSVSCFENFKGTAVRQVQVPVLTILTLNKKVVGSRTFANKCLKYTVEPR